ncbi:MAG: hypothetical protein ACXABF_04935 [Candidatus Thorarchaeota archaeon]
MRNNRYRGRILVILIIPLLAIQMVAPISDKGVVLNRTLALNDDVKTFSSISSLNVTQTIENLWNNVSIENLTNFTKAISRSYGDRLWFTSNMSPSSSLEGAWAWANLTLMSNTSVSLSFRHVTEYQSLLAIKNGTGSAPRPALVISGIIDSGYSKGANEAAVSAAAVLETARVLDQYSLSFDVYYVLLNSARIGNEYDRGARAFAAWMDENSIETLTSFAFDRLLYRRASYTYGTNIVVRSFHGSDVFQETDWIPKFMQQVSEIFGNSMVIYLPHHISSEFSLAFEMWELNMTGVHIAQGRYFDSISGTVDDLWDETYYNYTQAFEAVASSASVLVYIGLLGLGGAAVHYQSGFLENGLAFTQEFVPSYADYINITATWAENAMIEAQIKSVETDQIVYQRTENDGFLQLKYLAHILGDYSLTLINHGPENVTFYVTITYLDDFDGDFVSNIQELDLGMNVFSSDTDLDGLSDAVELVMGTDPTSADSDGDGASDYDEYIWGSSPFITDSDGDTIPDGLEAILGTNPTMVDSDLDALDDWNETYTYFTSPISADTDSDGLDDGFEISIGLNPLSPDTDGDSLSDLFEILNQLNPLSVDTDGDGWSDAYEVEFCLSPISTDTDGDFLPDGIDWDPREHWISVVAPVALVAIIVLIGIIAYIKHRAYLIEG